MENLFYSIYIQWNLGSVCVPAQFDQSVPCLHEVSTDHILSLH